MNDFTNQSSSFLLFALNIIRKLGLKFNSFTTEIDIGLRRERVKKIRRTYVFLENMTFMSLENV